MSNWLDLCRPRPCIACGRDDGTIVPAHRNEGKGMGMKTPDWTVIPLCLKCHDFYDNGDATLAEKREFWCTHWQAHHMGLCQAELIGPVGMSEGGYRRPAKLLKILPRNSDRPWPPRAA